MRIKLSILAALSILFIAAFACGSSATPQLVGTSTTQTNSGAASTQSGSMPTNTQMAAAATSITVQTYKIGDIVQIGDLTLVVNSFTFSNGNSTFAPDAGKRFAIVDVTFQNNGTSSAQLSSMLQMSLKDDTSQAYSIDISAEVASGGKSPEGELAAGEKLRGQVGFQVPTTAKGFQFVFDASLFSSGKVIIDLGQ